MGPCPVLAATDILRSLHLENGGARDEIPRASAGFDSGAGHDGSGILGSLVRCWWG